MTDRVHEFRKSIDANIQEADSMIRDLKGAAGAREAALVKTKLQEAKMWAGKILEALGSELPKEYQDKA